MHTLDTNAIIYFLKGEESSVACFLDEVFIGGRKPYIASITALELLSFPSLTRDEEIRIMEFLGIVSVLPLDMQIAKVAASLRRSYRQKTPDAAIAATALLTGSTLVTRNMKDFSHIPNLSIRKI